MTNPETQAPTPQPLSPTAGGAVDADVPAPLPGEGAQTAREPTPGAGDAPEGVLWEKAQNRGLKRLRNPGTGGIRAIHSWGNPNRKRAAKIKRRRAWYDATLAKNSRFPGEYHRPGSWKK